MPGGPLSQILIKPAGADCNLRCVYCFYLEKSALYPEQRIHRMSDDVLREMARQMMSSGLPQLGFSWQGGEPTLMGLDFFRAAVDYQKRFGRSGQVVANSLQTNGLLIDAEWAKFLAEYNFLVGLSLDGPPDVHDYYRLTANKKPSHALTLRAGEIMREHGAEFNILAVVNEHSAKHAARIYQYFREHGFDFMQFIPCIERDPRTDGPAPFSPSPEAYGDFLCSMFDEWVKDFRDGLPTVSERTLDSLMHTYLGEPSPMCIFMEQCGDYVVVEHSGDVYSCDFYVEPACHLGNLAEREMGLLAVSSQQIAFGGRKSDRPPECAHCRWIQHCFGGCLKDRFTIPGTKGSNYFCKSYKQLFAHSETTMLEVRDRWIERFDAPEAPTPEPALSQAPNPVPQTPYPNAGQRVGRNAPCPCGSGKKFKKCCMRKA